MKMTVGDLLPSAVVDVTVDGLPVDFTTASSVTVVGTTVETGVQLFSRAATSATAQGVVTLAWQASDTNAARTISLRIVGVFPGGTRTFLVRQTVNVTA